MIIYAFSILFYQKIRGGEPNSVISLKEYDNDYYNNAEFALFFVGSGMVNSNTDAKSILTVGLAGYFYVKNVLDILTFAILFVILYSKILLRKVRI